MTQLIEEQLSAFMDDELPAEELELLLARLDRDPAARGQLGRYAMVGECIRGGSGDIGALGLGERVRAAIAADTSQSAPASRPSAQSSTINRGWVAAGLAASAAIVTLFVGGPANWGRDGADRVVASTPVALPALDEPLDDIHPSVNRRLDPRAAARLTGYLVAHGQYTNQLARNNFDSHVVSARAERASWRQPRDATDVR